MKQLDIKIPKKIGLDGSQVAKRKRGGLTYIAYLDEFGHVGPYISRTDPRHNGSPIFGLAGIVLPVDEVRGFGTWFFQRKRDLLASEIKHSGKRPAMWEKKGTSLYTAKNVTKYAEIRQFTNRFLNKIKSVNGFVFYVGQKKRLPPDEHNPENLYRAELGEAIKRIDQFCSEDCDPPSNFLMVIDDNSNRDAQITRASLSMYGEEKRTRLIEPPFHVPSHRFQTMQAADWIAGLVGKIGVTWVDPETYRENDVHRKYFGERLKKAEYRSGIKL